MIGSDKNGITLALLVPCYNAENYLEEFISNLHNLTEPFDEVIFYDDGSNDSTYKVLLKHEVKYITSKVNNGPSYARNRLAEASKCKYIHFHDVDDTLIKDYVSVFKQKIIKENADVILGNADWIDKISKKTLIKWEYDIDELQKDPLAYFLTHPLGIINTVYKKKSFMLIKGFDQTQRCWEDADLNTRISAELTRFSFINKTVAYSLRHDLGISQNQANCWNCRIFFLINYYQNFQSRYHNIIISEISKSAWNLFELGDKKSLSKVVNLAQTFGIYLPVNKNPIIKFLKIFKIRGIILFKIHGLALRALSYLRFKNVTNR